MRPTLRDLARLSGYSLATVAYAMQGHPRVAAATRKTIRALAEQHGYVPDRAAAILGRRKNRTGTRPRGVAVAQWVHAAPGDGSYMRLERELRGHAGSLGYLYQLYNLWDVRDWPRFVRSQAARGVVGVLVRETHLEAIPPEISLDRFCVVCIDASPARPRLGFHRVRPAFEDGIMRCCEIAVARGYRRIGLAPFSHADPTLHDWRLRAVAECCRERFPGSVLPGLPWLGPHDDPAGFRRWAARVRPDAVVSLHTGAYWWLRDSGLKIPDDVGFCAAARGHGGPQEEMISGLEVSEVCIAKTALDLLGQLLIREETGRAQIPLELLLHPAWVEGETLPQRINPRRSGEAGRGRARAPDA